MQNNAAPFRVSKVVYRSAHLVMRGSDARLSRFMEIPLRNPYIDHVLHEKALYEGSLRILRLTVKGPSTKAEQEELVWRIQALHAYSMMAEEKYEEEEVAKWMLFGYVKADRPVMATQRRGSPMPSRQGAGSSGGFTARDETAHVPWVPKIYTTKMFKSAQLAALGTLARPFPGPPCPATSQEPYSPTAPGPMESGRAPPGKPHQRTILPSQPSTPTTQPKVEQTRSSKSPPPFVCSPRLSDPSTPYQDSKVSSGDTAEPSKITPELQSDKRSLTAEELEALGISRFRIQCLPDEAEDVEPFYHAGVLLVASTDTDEATTAEISVGEGEKIGAAKGEEQTRLAECSLGRPDRTIRSSPCTELAEIRKRSL